MATEPPEAAPDEQTAKKGNKLIVIVAVVAGLLIFQGVGVLIAVKLMNRSPLDAAGIELPDTEEDHESTGQETEETAELLIANLQCPHTSTGRSYVIRMTVYAIVPAHLLTGHGEQGSHGEGEGPQAGDLKALLKKNEATIKHRMRTIIASSDAGTLCLTNMEKPDFALSTLRRHFKKVLEDVLGKDKVKDVLIPDYMPSPSN